MRAAIYTRYSTEHQREASIEDQVRRGGGSNVSAQRHALAIFVARNHGFKEQALRTCGQPHTCRVPLRRNDTIANVAIIAAGVLDRGHGGSSP
jgi:hypothetical protein